MMKMYSKGIMIPITIIIFFAMMILVSAIDGGAETGGHPIEKNAIIQTVVILEDGNEYIVAEKSAKVTVNTYGSDDPKHWEIVR